MPSEPLVQRRFGPALPELAGPWLARVPRAARVAALVVAAAVVVALVLRLVTRTPGTPVVVSGPVTFNLGYQAPLRRVAPGPGELLRLQQVVRGKLIQSFVVRPLRLGPYRGDPAGALPIAAVPYEASLARRFAGFRLEEEGRVRTHGLTGYAVLFSARLGPRHLYGRFTMMPEQSPGARTGVAIEMLSTPAGGASSPVPLGLSDPLKLSYLTFTFGRG